MLWFGGLGPLAGAAFCATRGTGSRTTDTARTNGGSFSQIKEDSSKQGGHEHPRAMEVDPTSSRWRIEGRQRRHLKIFAALGLNLRSQPASGREIRGRHQCERGPGKDCSNAALDPGRPLQSRGTSAGRTCQETGCCSSGSSDFSSRNLRKIPAPGLHLRKAVGTFISASESARRGPAAALNRATPSVPWR